MKTPTNIRSTVLRSGLAMVVGLLVAMRSFGGSTAATPGVDWNITALDQAIATVPAGEKFAQIGDMLVPLDYLQDWRNQLAGIPQPKSAFYNGFIPWTSGNVYYSFDASVTSFNQKVFLDCAAEWATFANLRFIARSTQANYILVTNNATLNGGLSAVGMSGGAQLLQIGTTAWNHSTIVHELGHALGMCHEQQRSDRDSYVTIGTNNILSGHLPDFAILTASTNKGPYDFLSVMHYARDAFSSNTLDTIQTKPAYNQYINIMGRQFDPVLSTNDRAGMASIYGAGPGASSVVTNTMDSGPGSLRAALYYAFDHPGTTVTFNIPNTDPGLSNNVFNIQPSDVLPSLVNATTLNGNSEPLNTNPNGPDILINGTLCHAPILYVNGVQLKGTNCTVRGLTVNNFNQYGIIITGTNARNNTVSGCFAGVDPTGTVAVTNGLCPIHIGGGAVSNIVGGTVAADRNIISGSALQGITISDVGTSFNVVEGNYIGLNAAGTAALPNTWSGLEIFSGAVSNVIGGTVAGAGNVISGNGNYGVDFNATGVSGNSVLGNYIGLNPAGTAAIPNAYAGIIIWAGASSNTIGGLAPGARNIISGNANDGVLVTGTTSAGNLVVGNYIGLNAAGSAALGNTWAGVDFQGGAINNFVATNVISGNGHDGVLVLGSPTAGNRVTGNYIGVNPAGTAALANTWGGVDIQGGAVNNVVSGNVISGNSQAGVGIGGTTTSGNLVTGNYIGVNAAGTAALANGFSGVDLFSGTVNNVVNSNVISANLNYGVILRGSFNSVWGNFIGVNAAGTAALGNSFGGVGFNATAISNTVGGVTRAARNVISGNNGQGILLVGSPISKNLIQGNYIGLNAAGTAAIANAYSGIEINSGPSANVIGGIGGARNFISGNGNYGININNGSSANVIQGNTIGLNGTNGAAVPNSFANVIMFASASNNVVGGITPGAANLISASTADGVQISDSGSTNNTIRGNSIFGNTGNAIGLFSSGNRSIVAPSLTSAVVTTNTTVVGTYNGVNGTIYQLDFYSDLTPAVSAESMTYLGSRSFTGTGASSGFTASFGALVPSGRAITASATDPSGNTSALSAGRAVTLTSTPNDGIPDAWRALYFGAPGTSTNSSSYAAGDPDHDGLSNLQEFLAGTNPTNPVSVFKLTAQNPVSTANAVSINSSNGIVYRVLYSDDLTAGRWDILADQILGNGANVFLGDPAASVTPRRFYRAQVLW